jgi:uncharacterized protein (DUF433 family)
VPPPTPDEIKTLPAYTLAEAARYLGVSEATLRTWFRGKPGKTTADGALRKDPVKPVLPTEAGPREPLSFIDLIEAHVLFSLRNAYKFPMRKVKLAMEYLASHNEGDLTVLARQDFFHDCGDLYLGFDKTLLTLTDQGQLADKTILTVGLQQITYGADGFADKFFPKTGNVGQNKFVVDPEINYGRISIVRLGVGADAIAARFKAGEKVMDIAEDYGATPEEVVEAVVWHDRLAA